MPLYLTTSDGELYAAHEHEGMSPDEQIAAFIERQGVYGKDWVEVEKTPEPGQPLVPGVRTWVRYDSIVRFSARSEA